jgi:L-asparaginase
VLGTGGTIAGTTSEDSRIAYTAGQLSVEALVGPLEVACAGISVTCEQVSNIPSQDVSDAFHARLLARVERAPRECRANALVITHGTDSLEETAFLLAAAAKLTVPVIITGAFRPATAAGSDGPGNLLDAIRTAAAATQFRPRVLVAFDAQLHEARFATKHESVGTRGFSSGPRGVAGHVVRGEVRWIRPVIVPHYEFLCATAEEIEHLPRVDILYAYPGMDGTLIDAAIAAGAAGLVVAGFGAGTFGNLLQEALERAVAAGLIVVRGTRVAFASVERNVEIDDDRAGFVVAGSLSPSKARVMLRLALRRSRDRARIQQWFDELRN